MIKPLIGALALLASLAAASPPAFAQTGVETDRQKFSYGIGLQIARNLQRQGLGSVDVGALAAAIEDVLAGKAPRVSIEELRAAALAYQETLKAERQAKADKNRDDGAAFLARNRDADGVVALDNGLQYRVLKEGAGEKPKPTDKVRVHYRGQLLDGTEFDSSYRRGEPTSLALDQVIPGWQEALTRMPVGSQWEVWIPPELAYGERGAGDRIGPNQTLHFTIDLVGIDEKK